ncbi:hypothetical protein ACFWMS_29055 [Peribacillus butanolivorans]|uniref:hypothetical protein n=1 Tax=Peribacillus butanolivorans TaxID=421767 RepID=UPI00364E6735
MKGFKFYFALVVDILGLVGFALTVFPELVPIMRTAIHSVSFWELVLVLNLNLIAIIRSINKNKNRPD